jgi:hypothetical protein
LAELMSFDGLVRTRTDPGLNDIGVATLLELAEEFAQRVRHGVDRESAHAYVPRPVQRQQVSNGNGGLKWIQKGGGYYSECNKRLKG